MKKQTVLAWVLLVLSVILGVVSYFVLPETVVTQFSLGNSNVSTAPKLFAVLLPVALGVGGALLTIFGKGDENGKWKSVIVSFVGIVVFILMLAVNL